MECAAAVWCRAQRGDDAAGGALLDSHQSDLGDGREPEDVNLTPRLAHVDRHAVGLGRLTARIARPREHLPRRDLGIDHEATRRRRGTSLGERLVPLPPLPPPPLPPPPPRHPPPPSRRRLRRPRCPASNPRWRHCRATASHIPISAQVSYRRRRVRHPPRARARATTTCCREGTGADAIGSAVAGCLRRRLRPIADHNAAPQPIKVGGLKLREGLHRRQRAEEVVESSIHIVVRRGLRRARRDRVRG